MRKSIILLGISFLCTGLFVACDASPPASPVLYSVVLDFQTDGTGMTVTYRVGTESQVTEVIADTYYSYQTEAPLGSTIFTRLQPNPSDAWCSVTITADGQTIGGSSDLGEVMRTDTLQF